MSLTSVAAPIWNEIAKTQTLRTAWARKAFQLGQEGMAALEGREWRDLVQKGVSQQAATAYVTVKPLLLENVAISKFTQEQPNYRQALPEIVSISEAVLLASGDYPLSQTQQSELRKLLEAEYS